MTRDDIIRIAREAGMPPVEITSDKPVLYPVPDAIERFAALIAAAEREACAKVCEKEQFELTQDVAGANGLQHFDAGCRCCAEMIRRRGET